MNRTYHTRLSRLESKRQAALPSSVAIVDVVGMTPTEAETAIEDKRQELQAAGYGGYLVILDA